MPNTNPTEKPEPNPINFFLAQSERDLQKRNRHNIRTSILHLDGRWEPNYSAPAKKDDTEQSSPPTRQPIADWAGYGSLEHAFISEGKVYTLWAYDENRPVTKNSISGAPKSEETITEQENSAIKPPENKWSVDVFPITHDFSEEEFSKFVEHKWYCVEYYVEGPVKIVASVSLSPASSPTPKIARAGSSFVRCNGTIGVIHNTHSPSLLSKEL